MADIVRTLRFSRTVKTEVQGRGITVALVMEVEGLWLTDPHQAVLNLVDKEDGRVTLQLMPEPQSARILTASATPVEFSEPSTPTSFVDISAAIDAEDEEEAVLDRAASFLTPPVERRVSMRSELMASVADATLQGF